MTTCRIVCLLSTLFFLDSEMMGNYFSYRSSSELVFAIAKIQKHRGQEVFIYSRLGNTHYVRMSLSYQQHPPSHNNCPTQCRMGRKYRKYHRTILCAKRKFKQTMPTWLAAKARRRVRIERMLQLVHSETIYAKFDFDATLGFPGEGWKQFTAATWNTRSLTHERYEYYKSLGYDILAITEVCCNQCKYQTKTKEFIVSEAKIIQKGPKKGTKRYTKDSAAGVGIILSPHMQKKVHSFGSNGERVCWVRLKGPV